MVEQFFIVNDAAIHAAFILVALIVFYSLGRWTGYARGVGETTYRLTPKPKPRG